MGAMKGVAGLKGDDIPAAGCRHLLTHLVRIQTKILEVLMRHRPNRRQPAGDPPPRTRHQLPGVGMGRVRRAKECEHFSLGIDLERLIHIQDREHVATGVRELHPAPGLDRSLGGKGDGEREQRAIREPHSREAGLIVRLAHETAERGKGAGQKHFEVVQRARTQGEFHVIHKGVRSPRRLIEKRGRRASWSRETSRRRLLRA